MLTRLFFIALLMGMTLGLTSNVAIADDNSAEATQDEKEVDKPAPPEWEDRGREDRPRGDRPPPRQMRDDERRRPGRGMRGRMGMDERGAGIGGPERGRPGMGKPRKPGGMPGGMRGGMPGGMGRMGRGMGGPGMGMRFDPMQKSDPEMYKLHAKDRELERKTMELSKQFRSAPAEKPGSEPLTIKLDSNVEPGQLTMNTVKGHIKEQLEKVVGQHFEVRQERRQLELKRMEKELNRLKLAIERRQEARDDIIKRRIMRLTGEEDPLEF